MKAIHLPLLLLVLAPVGAQPAVLKTTAHSIEVQLEVVVQARPDVAYETFARDLPRWWDAAHSWSGDSANLSLDPRAGGCFCEKLPGGGSVKHGEVIFARPGSLLRLDAALGPFQEMAVQGVLSFRFEPDGQATRVTVHYRVFGLIPAEPATLAPHVNTMLEGQMHRFRDHVATTRKG